MITRPATHEDAAFIADIYNQGIHERVATFETAPRALSDVLGWIASAHPIVVVESDNVVVAFASVSSYRPRECYAGVGEFSVYVDKSARGKGVGRMAMEALCQAAASSGYWKLLSRIFPENKASLALMKSLGFREVGVYHRHAKLDGQWRDVVIVEKLIGEGLNS